MMKIIANNYEPKDIIRIIREWSVLSQKDICNKLSIADNTISSYERENSQPDFETITKIANICDFEICFYNKKTKTYLSVSDLSKKS